MKKIDLELFHFNAKTDYLPYYKKISMQIEDHWTILKILNSVNTVQEYHFIDSELFCLKVNNISVLASEQIKNIVDLSKIATIKIDPISSYRAVHDLMIDTKDFTDKFQPFKQYDTDGSLKKFYVSKMLDYYASSTLEFNKEYIGEAALLTSFKLIKEQPNSKNEICQILKDEYNGIWFHTSLKNLVLDDNETTTVFEELFEIVTNQKINQKSDEKVDYSHNQSFVNFNIGYYQISDDIKTSIKNSNANCVVLDSRNQDIATHCYDFDFTLKISARILLEAIDNNCDFLIVQDNDILKVFDANQHKIAKIAGRDINLPIITKKQFAQLIDGEKNIKQLGFDTHKVKINFL